MHMHDDRPGPCSVLAAFEGRLVSACVQSDDRLGKARTICPGAPPQVNPGPRSETFIAVYSFDGDADGLKGL